MQTLKLNGDWDIQTNAAGGIAVSTDEYATAQTCANAVRLFTNDAYFNQDRGIPHFDIELGKPLGISQAELTNRIQTACLAVEGVTDCKVELEMEEGRVLGGNIYVTTEGGTSVIAI